MADPSPASACDQGAHVFRIALVEEVLDRGFSWREDLMDFPEALLRKKEGGTTLS